ncbi:MAG: DUF4920 domain-containing protein [Pseudomonadota bacterium]
MRSNSLVFGIVLLMACGVANGNQAVRLSEPVTADAHSETFGAPLPAGVLPVPLGSILSAPDAFLDQPIVVTAQVGQVCQKKGCFFIAQDAGAAVRVSFKDYSFFVPTDISGRRVTLAATLHARNLSAAEAEHLKSDAGEGSKLTAGRVYELVATSARVPRAGAAPTR